MNWIDQTGWKVNSMTTIKLSKWLREYEQVFQLRETRLSLKRKEVDHVIILKELELKLSSLILTRLEK